ncbi:MAG: UDP-N-acetylmuramate--L-alanine ligase [Parachlamydiaceae bacterium]
MKEAYHFIGIGGIGMSGLARMLLRQGMTVTGSDIAFNWVIENLTKEGAVIYKGHAEEHIHPPTHVIYTSDIKPDNPEYLAAIKMGCPIWHRADLLAYLLKGSQGLAVAGTHGKTTTSSLLATVLVEAEMDPSFVIGGILPAFQSNCRLGQGKLFAFEADESDRSFLKYHPFGAIITNIDHDHLNAYHGNFRLLIENFRQFMLQVQSPAHLFWCRDDQYLRDLHLQGQTYGFHPESDWRILTMNQEGFRTSFDIEHQKQLHPGIELPLIGRHNVLNAAAVFGLALSLGLPEEKIRQGLKTFKGVLRRCEDKGICQQIQFLDDYAHHPTEVQTTLEGIRQAIDSRRLIAIFQPHRYTRTYDCLGSYGTIFEAVDEVIVTDIYGGGEAPIAHLSHEQILNEIAQHSDVSCRYISRPALSHFLSEFSRPGDVIVTLGAGNITHVSAETMVMLEKRTGA